MFSLGFGLIVYRLVGELRFSAKEMFGVVEDTLVVKYSIHDDDEGRQYLSNGKHTVWLNDSAPIEPSCDIFMGADNEPYVANGDVRLTAWCKDLFKRFEEPWGAYSILEHIIIVFINLKLFEIIR